MAKRFKCPLCDYSSTGGRVEAHIEKVHRESPPDLYVRHVLSGSDTGILCLCGCGQRTRWLTWSKGFAGGFIRGHNARLNEYSALSDEDVRKKAIASRVRSYQDGTHVVWNKGLSNKSDPRVQRMHEKASETIREKYRKGDMISWQRRSPVQHQKALEKVRKQRRLDLSEIQRRIESVPCDVEILTDLALYEKRQKTLLEFRCADCGETWSKTLKNLEDTPKCPMCFPGVSYNQLEIYQHIQDLIPGENVLMSDRKAIAPYELDIYVPSRNFAVEFNGLGFHTEEHVSKDYHQMKSDMCVSKGINLLHVFSDEWKNPIQQKVVKSMIAARLGLCERVYARNCIVEEVETRHVKNFIEENHLDGYVRSKKAWVLKHGGEIVTVMTVRAPTHRKKYEKTIEIARFCTKKELVVVGGLGKMLRKVESWARQKGYKNILSYADTRHGTGKCYESVGFVMVGTTAIRFWWTDKKSRFDRFHIRADSQKNLTERDAAYAAKVLRVYGTRNKIYIKQL